MSNTNRPTPAPTTVLIIWEDGSCFSAPMPEEDILDALDAGLCAVFRLGSNGQFQELVGAGDWCEVPGRPELEPAPTELSNLEDSYEEAEHRQVAGLDEGD